MEQIRVAVPARPAFVHILRAVSAAVAAHLQLSYDDIEDLRLAVDEACAYLLGLRPRGDSLEMTIESDGAALVVVASMDAGDSDAARPDAHQTMMWSILSALTDEARFERTETGQQIRMSKRVPAA